jgi:hypothetical protein
MISQNMKKLIMVLTAACVVFVSCAAIPHQTLGGNRAVISIEVVIGKTRAELQQKLGVPFQTNVCKVPDVLTEQQGPAQGDALIWKHEYANLEERIREDFKIVACFFGDIAVAEHREWFVTRGGIAFSGKTDIANRDLARKAIEDLIENNDRRYLDGTQRGLEI